MLAGEITGLLHPDTWSGYTQFLAKFGREESSEIFSGLILIRLEFGGKILDERKKKCRRFVPEKWYVNRPINMALTCRSYSYSHGINSELPFNYFEVQFSLR